LQNLNDRIGRVCYQNVSRFNLVYIQRDEEDGDRGDTRQLQHISLLNML